MDARSPVIIVEGDWSMRDSNELSGDMEVTIIIVSYNTCNMTRECIDFSPEANLCYSL